MPVKPPDTATLTIAAVVKAVGENRWIDATKWPIAVRRPTARPFAPYQIRKLALPGCLVREDPFALLDLLQYIISRGMPCEADSPIRCVMKG